MRGPHPKKSQLVLVLSPPSRTVLVLVLEKTPAPTDLCASLRGFAASREPNRPQSNLHRRPRRQTQCSGWKARATKKTTRGLPSAARLTENRTLTPTRTRKNTPCRLCTPPLPSHPAAACTARGCSLRRHSSTSTSTSTSTKNRTIHYRKAALKNRPPSNFAASRLRVRSNTPQFAPPCDYPWQSVFIRGKRKTHSRQKKTASVAKENRIRGSPCPRHRHALSFRGSKTGPSGRESPFEICIPPKPGLYYRHSARIRGRLAQLVRALP